MVCLWVCRGTQPLEWQLEETEAVDYLTFPMVLFTLTASQIA